MSSSDSIQEVSEKSLKEAAEKMAKETGTSVAEAEAKLIKEAGEKAIREKAEKEAMELLKQVGLEEKANEKKMAEYILEASKDESDINGLGNNGKTYYQEHFDKEKLLDELEQMMEELIERNQKS